MVDRTSRIRPLTVFLIGLCMALTGGLAIVIARAADVGWLLTVGIVVLVLGALTALGTILPERHDGTRIWQTDQGKAV